MLFGKFQKPVWKFDWRETLLEIVDGVNWLLWLGLGMVFGAWAMTIDPGQLDFYRQHGEQAVIGGMIVTFTVDLLRIGLGKWLGPKEAKA